MCLSGITAPLTQSTVVAGTPDIGGTVSFTLTTTFAAAAATPAHFSVSPAQVSMQVTDASQTASATVSIDSTSGSFTIFPPGRTTSWLTISAASASGSTKFTLSASGAGLSNGVYNATLILRTVNSIPQYLKVPIAFTVGASTTTTITSVSSFFSGIPVLAPGMLVSIAGTNLAPSAQHAGKLPLPLSMQGVSATVNGVSAPILDVLKGQLNIQIPYETSAGTAVLGVNNNGKVASFLVPVAATSPDIWPHFVGQGTNVTQASRGAVLTTFITGEGDVTLPLADGDTPSSNSPPTAPRLPLTVFVGGVQATVLFAGIPSGLAGVTQINFVVPKNAPLGAQSVSISVGGVPSKPVDLTVTGP
jgi:uncharacterized protein (TIGR03437 family)